MLVPSATRAQAASPRGRTTLFLFMRIGGPTDDACIFPTTLTAFTGAARFVGAELLFVRLLDAGASASTSSMVSPPLAEVARGPFFVWAVGTLNEPPSRDVSSCDAASDLSPAMSDETALPFVEPLGCPFPPLGTSAPSLS
eukprot:scaffold134387_cov31-Tisochrysis_lutea.AAC.2